MFWRNGGNHWEWGQKTVSSSLPKTRQLQQRIQVLLVSALGWYDFLFTYLFCLFGCFVANFFFWSCFSNIRGEQCSQMFWTTTVQCKSKSVQIQVITFFCLDTCQGFLPAIAPLLKGKVRSIEYIENMKNVSVFLPSFLDSKVSYAEK